jgi:hypothetical protein
MAKLKGNLLSGLLGPLVFSIVDGKQRVKTACAPGTMKQTKATKEAADTFGMGSGLSAKIRKTLATQLGGFYDGDMANRLTRKVVGILGLCRNQTTRLFEFDRNSFSGLEKLEFNLDAKVETILKKPPAVELSDGIVSVSFSALEIPEQLKFPYKSFRCQLDVNISLLRLRDGLFDENPETRSLILTKDKTEAGPYEFNFPVPDGCLCIVSLFLIYSSPVKTGRKAMNHKKFNPGSIIAALFTPGTYRETDHRNWMEMIKFQ